MTNNVTGMFQSQQLPVPSRWGPEERRFMLALQQAIDTIYAKFGRITVDDLAAAAVKQIIDDATIGQGQVTGLTAALALKLDAADVYNALDRADEGAALDARQGKALADALALRAVATDVAAALALKLDAGSVYNALDQANAGCALDARQGKTLADALAALTTRVAALEEASAPAE